MDKTKEIAHEIIKGATIISTHGLFERLKRLDNGIKILEFKGIKDLEDNLKIEEDEKYIVDRWFSESQAIKRAHKDNIYRFNATESVIRSIEGHVIQLISKKRPKFNIWDKYANDWYKPVYKGFEGQFEELLLTPHGALTMRTIDKIIDESMFPNRFEVIFEQPKVIIPRIVAVYLEDCKKRNIKLVSALCPFKMGYGNEIELWFDSEDNNRLFALAWINGYEVEKEPRYVVKVGKLYAKEPLGDMSLNVVLMTRSESSAYKFSDKEAARKCALNLDGSIYKIGENNEK